MGIRSGEFAVSLPNVFRKNCLIFTK